MTEPALYEEGKIPAVSLDGKAWPVPVFVWRQLSESRRKIMDLNDVIIGRADGKNRVDGNTSERYVSLTDEQYKSMGEVVYQALLGLHPRMTVEEFRNMRISDGELFSAFLVARRQSGIYVFREGAENETNEDGDGDRKPPGEAEAQSPSRTGTE